MSDKRPLINSNALLLLQVIGGIAFLVSFVMPAVSIPEDRGVGPTTQPGFMCALFSPIMLLGTIKILAKGEATSNVRENIGLFLSGWSSFNNLLLIVYCFPSHWRRTIALVALVNLVNTGVAFTLLHFTPLAGFYLWSGGTVLLLCSGVATGSVEPKS